MQRRVEIFLVWPIWPSYPTPLTSLNLSALNLWELFAPRRERIDRRENESKRVWPDEHGVGNNKRVARQFSSRESLRDFPVPVVTR